MIDIVVLGIGGHGRETLEVIEAINSASATFRIRGFLDDGPRPGSTTVHGLPVLGARDWLLSVHGERPALALGLGSPALRARAADWADRHRISVPSLVHPTALVSPRAALGRGCLVMASCRISIDVSVGAFAHLNYGTSVAHDCELAPFVTLAPAVSLAGGTRIGVGAELGVGAVTVPLAQIGEWSVVGAGAVVARPIPDNVVAAGVPATVRRTRAPGWHLEA
jgi:sugar O-acyltransferase (sialic acid O-acetyltransferase NeuD family)